MCLSKEDHNHHFVGRTKWQRSIGHNKVFQARPAIVSLIIVYEDAHTHAHAHREAPLAVQRRPVAALIPNPDVT